MAWTIYNSSLLLMRWLAAPIERVLQDYAADVTLLHQWLCNEISSLPEVLNQRSKFRWKIEKRTTQLLTWSPVPAN